MRWPWSRRRVTFDSAPRPIVEMFAEMNRSTGTSVSRSEALSVPAVRRGRNEICSLATMPLEQLAPDNTVVPSVLLSQIDPDVANVVTLAQTVEDLLFESIAWWLVTSKDPEGGFPTSARHLATSRVSLTPPTKQPQGSPSPLPSGHDPREAVVYVDGQPVGASRIIRFDSPNPAVLQHAGREIRRAILLDRAAGVYADGGRPDDYFSPADGADPADDDDIEELLAKWKARRKRHSTAYVPESLKYNTVDSPNPQQLQLAELSKQASLDIANSLGIDPEDLGISTTSRTYSNDVDRRRNKINEVLGPYMLAITGRLSMGDVTPPGHRVRFNTTEYLTPNPGERWTIYSTERGKQVITDAEVRQNEGMAPAPEADTPAAAAGAESSPELLVADLARQLYLSKGVILTAPEIRTIINRATGAGLDVNAPVSDPAAPLPPAPEEAPVAETEQVAADRAPAFAFDGPQTFTLDMAVEEFSVDRENRIIEGLAVPYGQYGTKDGITFRFDKGALQWQLDEPGRVKLVFPRHGEAVGRAIQLRNSAGGLFSRFKVGRGPEGDRALQSAEDGVFDGFSIGVDFDAKADTSHDPRRPGAMLVRRADLRHVALTDAPVFDNARVTHVAASRDQGGPMPADTETTEPVTAPEPPTDPQPAAPAVPEPVEQPTGLQLSQDQLAAVLAVPGAFQAITHQPAPEPTAAPTSLNLSMEQLGQLMGLASANAALGVTPSAPAPAPVAEGPTPVDPTRSLNLSVTSEALPYRFDRGGRFTQAEHEFSTDVVDMLKRGDNDGTSTESGRRVMEWVRAQFSTVAVGDVNELNPDIQRPDMYVDQRDYRYPIWEAIQKGPPPNGVQPFVFPKFSSASGLVGAHTEGVEPTGGTFVTTSQTVTPTGLSGKASLTREIWDTGGNPAVSTLIWNQMVRGYNEARETAAATFLNTLTAATDINLGVATVDDVLVAAWDTAVADLQFVRGYDFETFVVEQRLYRAFVDASDTDGRKLIPQINPTNASGSAARRFTQLDLAGATGIPSWALTATPGAANNSWLFDPMTVHGWATEPQRLDLLGSGGTAAGADYKPIAFIDIGIWGYSAFANSDIGGVRQVIYDDA